MILNLTQHPASAEQLAAGVTDLVGDAHRALVAHMTVGTLPTRAQIQHRADALALLASCHAVDAAGQECPAQVMIGGAPWMMAPLEAALRALRLDPVYAFSVRESSESVQPDGTVRKVATFRHAGFITA